MSFIGALLFAAIVLFFAGILAYAVAVHERRLSRRQQNAALTRDQQTPPERIHLRGPQVVAPRLHGQLVDPFGLNSHAPPHVHIATSPPPPPDIGGITNNKRK